MTVLYLLAFFLFLAYVGRLATRISRRSLTEWWLTSFLLLTGSVILTGFILSYFYQTGHALVWAGAVFITATVLAWVLRQLIPAPATGVCRWPADSGSPGCIPTVVSRAGRIY